MVWYILGVIGKLPVGRGLKIKVVLDSDTISSDSSDHVTVESTAVTVVKNFHGIF